MQVSSPDIKRAAQATSTPIPNPQNAFLSSLAPSYVYVNQTRVGLNHSDNPVFTNGSTITIEWSNNSSFFNVTVNAFNESAFLGYSDPINILTNCTDFRQSMEWTVSTQGLPSADMYDFWVISDEPSFFSQLFNISAKDVLSNPSSPTNSISPTPSALDPSAVTSPTTTSTLNSNSTSTPALNEAIKVGIALGAILGLIFLTFCSWLSLFLYKRFKTRKAEKLFDEATTHPPKKERKQSRPPYELDGVLGVLSPPGELDGASKQPGELEGSSRLPGELYGGLREPVELDGSSLQLELEGRNWLKQREG